MANEFIFHICRDDEWQTFKKNKIYNGSTQDIRDGFIHFSTKEQISKSAKKHRAGQDNLVLLTVDTKKLGVGLKWESSRGGDIFPHYYGVLELKAVIQADSLKLDQDKNHLFPVNFFNE